MSAEYAPLDAAFFSTQCPALEQPVIATLELAVYAAKLPAEFSTVQFAFAAAQCAAELASFGATQYAAFGGP